VRIRGPSSLTATCARRGPPGTCGASRTSSLDKVGADEVSAVARDAVAATAVGYNAATAG
jgi:hypothetical protein